MTRYTFSISKVFRPCGSVSHGHHHKAATLNREEKKPKHFGLNSLTIIGYYKWNLDNTVTQIFCFYFLVANITDLLARMGWKCVPRETAARWSDRFHFKHSLVHLRLRWSVVSLSGSNSKRPGGGRQIPDGYTPKAFLNELTDSLQLPLNITCMFYEWDQTNWLLENKSSSQDSTIMAPEKKKGKALWVLSYAHFTKFILHS